MRLAFFLAMLLAPAMAAAIEVGASLEWVTDLSGNQPGQKQNGPGAEIRVGGTSRAGDVMITSELAAVVLAPGSARTYGGELGWRLRFGDFVQPGAIVRLGLGHHVGGGLESFTDGLYDVGGLLDFHPVPRMEMGLHITYGGFFSGGRTLTSTTCLAGETGCSNAGISPTWLAYGLHGSFRF